MVSPLIFPNTLLREAILDSVFSINALLFLDNLTTLSYLCKSVRPGAISLGTLILTGVFPSYCSAISSMQALYLFGADLGSSRFKSLYCYSQWSILLYIKAFYCFVRPRVVRRPFYFSILFPNLFFILGIALIQDSGLLSNPKVIVAVVPSLSLISPITEYTKFFGPIAISSLLSPKFLIKLS